MCSGSILLAVTRLIKQCHHCGGCAALVHLQKEASKQSEFTREQMRAITTPIRYE